MNTYDPKKFVLSFAGIPLNKGVAAGTFLEISGETAGFTKTVGVDGEVTRNRIHNRSAQARLTLKATSEVNDRLSARYQADRDAQNGRGVAVFFVRDLNGTTIGESLAWISDDPDISLDAEVGTRVWVFDLASWTPTHGSNPDEGPGA